ncbi:extracellular solute-binding protein [Nitrogeniibacter aestuarii]|uniref:extracellular solute-binding protein n=1 Tax=Nitrogeniibacter aestuarii TaxID=2815343 RepID=UPI001E6168D5|nr:extracellular solute-binding protein [Nitrogeniibacter aestuarii]
MQSRLMRSFARVTRCLMMVVALNTAGSAWATEKVVRIAAVEYSPYIGSALRRDGYAHEVVVEAFRLGGYQAKIDFFPPARARLQAIRGVEDGVLVIDDSVDDHDFIFSDTFPAGDIGLLKLKSEALDPRLAEAGDVGQLLERLESFRIGVVRGAGTAAVLERAGVGRLQFAVDNQQNIDKLVARRIDFALIDKFAAAAVMVERRPHLIGKLEFLPVMVSRSEFRLGIPRGRAQGQAMLDAFNQGLARLRETGGLLALQQDHGLATPVPQTAGTVTLNIATVDNEDMLVMKSLSADFEAEHPGIRLNWRVLEENTLRRRLLSELAIGEGYVDVMTIGAYEAPIWAQKGFLQPVRVSKAYGLDDLLPSVREALSFNGELYALPFYAESSMLYYRKDLFEAKGLQMPGQPTWDDVLGFAGKLHAPADDVYGICLRGKPGWGENMGIVSTMVNAYGGRWFDMQWRPDLDSPAWREALQRYRTLIGQFGPPRVTENGFNESLELFANGHCAMWVDATVAAGKLYNPGTSSVADKLGFAAAPTARTAKGSHWLWTWALAVPSSSARGKAAQTFIKWATSRDYIARVAKARGWVAVPPGTRRSTYANPAYQAAAPFAGFVLSAIEAADQIDSTLEPKPYIGIQWVNIPEFTAIGHAVGVNVGNMFELGWSVDRVVNESQREVEFIMRRAGYYESSAGGSGSSN